MEINKEIFQKAFKKLKSSVYYDKTECILRNDLVQFENKFETNGKLNESLGELCNKLMGSEEDFLSLCDEITSTIRYRAFPKKIKPKKDDTIIYNFSETTITIDELQYFIDLDIRGHVLGVVWLMLIGYRIDQQCIYKHSYGNRIRKTLLNEFSQNPTYSPYLFEPYFQQYESWRDEGLEKAQACLKEDKDVVIITMDFKRFYYSVDLTQEAFDQIWKDAEIEENDLSINALKRLHAFVFRVIQSYAKLFPEKEYQKRSILPIGFLPSNVLSNWCLRNFDKAIVDGWNPLYYGRYVDDILIVDKVEHNSDLSIKASKQELTKKEIVWYLLQQCTRWCGITTPVDSINIRYGIAPLIKQTTSMQEDQKTEGNEISYFVNPIYNPMRHDHSEIKLQNNKLKIFYFKSGDTDALLTCFKNEISKNKSEFRYMPEDDAVFMNNDYSTIYELHYEDTINKFRGIKNMAIDSYELSKFLGKYLRIGSLIVEKRSLDLPRIF